MGLSKPSSSGSRRSKALSEINVTPFVDVMLVLLIIFMVAAPMLEQGLDLNLPDVSAGVLKQEEKKINLTIQKNGKVYLDKALLPEKTLDKSLAAIIETRKEEPIFVQADEDVRYGLVARILGIIRGAGGTKIQLVTQEPQTQKNAN